MNRGEALFPIVEGKPEPVFPCGNRQLQIAHSCRQIGGIALLKAQQIDGVPLDQVLKLIAGLVFAQVVTDGPYQVNTPSSG
ncbi:hypothetical protein GCM10009582_10890 [Arthrobacter flavus]